MRATAVLIQEHGAIRLTMRAMEKIIAKAKQEEDINTTHLDWVVEILQLFADKCHHAKEEDVLIPEVRKLGIQDEDHLSQTILDEHVLARGYTKGIKEGLDKYKNGEKEIVQDIIQNATSYVQLIDKHIDKENLVFFPRSDAVLTGEQQQKMYEDFEKIETERIGEGTHERLHKMVDDLKNIYILQQPTS